MSDVDSIMGCYLNTTIGWAKCYCSAATLVMKDADATQFSACNQCGKVYDELEIYWNKFATEQKVKEESAKYVIDDNDEVKISKAIQSTWEKIITPAFTAESALWKAHKNVLGEHPKDIIVAVDKFYKTLDNAKDKSTFLDSFRGSAKKPETPEKIINNLAATWAKVLAK